MGLTNSTRALQSMPGVTVARGCWLNQRVLILMTRACKLHGQNRQIRKYVDTE